MYLILKEPINTDISQFFLKVTDSTFISSLSCDMTENETYDIFFNCSKQVLNFALGHCISAVFH